MELSNEAFEEWKEHPVTKEVFIELERVKQMLLFDLSTGMTLGHTADVTHGLTSKMVGHVEGINQLLNIEFDDPDPETENEVYRSLK